MLCSLSNASRFYMAGIAVRNQAGFGPRSVFGLQTVRRSIPANAASSGLPDCNRVRSSASQLHQTRQPRELGVLALRESMLRAQRWLCAQLRASFVRSIAARQLRNSATCPACAVASWQA